MTDKHTLLLSDGRSLDYYVSGPEGGLPLIWHHGTPGSGLQRDLLADLVHHRGLRLVTMSRAGYGTSSRHVGRQVVDVVSDTAALLAHLGASQSLIGGTSGGGPHALACAARLPGVLAVASVAGVAPFGLDDLDFLAGMGEGNIVEFGKSLEGEAVLRPFLEAEAEGLAGATPGQLIDAMSTLLPEVDRACITDEFGDGMIASMTEGLHRGVDGWVDDDLAFTRDWGFSLDEIAVPVFVWQGDADLMVPFAHGQWLAGRVPGATASLLAGEGHISIGVGKFGEILDSLLAVVSSDN